jgi:hypothetical protein
MYKSYGKRKHMKLVRLAVFGGLHTPQEIHIWLYCKSIIRIELRGEMKGDGALNLSKEIKTMRCAHNVRIFTSMKAHTHTLLWVGIF